MRRINCEKVREYELTGRALSWANGYSAGTVASVSCVVIYGLAASYATAAVPTPSGSKVKAVCHYKIALSHHLQYS